jgi:hypothetical protein
MARLENLFPLPLEYAIFFQFINISEINYIITGIIWEDEKYLLSRSLNGVY